MGKELHLYLDDFTYRQTIEAEGHKHNRSISKIEPHIVKSGESNCSGSEGKQRFWAWMPFTGAAAGLAFCLILHLIHKLFSISRFAREGA